MNEEYNTAIQPFIDVINEVVAMPEESLNETSIKVISNVVQEGFTPELKENAVNEIIRSFNNLNYTRGQARENLEATKNALKELVDTFDPSPNKRLIINAIMAPIHEVFDEALTRYHSYDIVLPMSLEEGAREPTYAHDTDAAADLYAAQDMVLTPHSLSNMVNTGVRLELPEGWMAVILPRSSMGAKTGLRLSNSAGIIDSDYRGPLGVLYDNISDSEYKITAGDRIAQLLVLPSYRFKAKIVDSVNETERGEGGFGSSGK